MNSRYSFHQKGFSLLEIMIALVIIAVLGGMAYPRYQKVVTRSKQTEAKNMLRNVYMGQSLYMTTHQEYADSLDKLDIEIPPDTRYTYELTVNESKATFTAIAQANLDTDPALDEWKIDESNQLENTVNDVIE